MSRGDRRLAAARKWMLERLARDEGAGFTRFEWIGSHDSAQCMGCRSRDRKVFSGWQLREILGVEFCFPDVDPGDKQGCRCLIRPHFVGSEFDASSLIPDPVDRQAWAAGMRTDLDQLKKIDQWTAPITYRAEQLDS